MLRGYRYRIYPNAEQSALIVKTLGCARFVYNRMLCESDEAHRNGLSFCSRNSFNYRLSSLKKEFPFLAEVDATALTAANDNLADAFTRFFKKQNKHPCFHRKKDFCSYTSKCVGGNIRIEGRYIRLPKIGLVRAKIHRMPKTDWKIKSATVSIDADGRSFCSILFKFEKDIVPISNPELNAIGLDYKSDGLFTDSNGITAGSPKFYRRGHQRLVKEQRKLSHMIEANIESYRVIGNKRYPIYRKPLEECRNIQKQRIKVARISSRIADHRKDHLHKLSTEIANQYDMVCVESLDMKVLSNKGFGNGKATLDNGYGMFLDMPAYKLHDRGKVLVRVDKWFPSSQMCCRCGTIHPEVKPLAVRKWTCPDCGTLQDRDINAAVNIRDKGISEYLQ